MSSDRLLGRGCGRLRAAAGATRRPDTPRRAAAGATRRPDTPRRAGRAG